MAVAIDEAGIRRLFPEIDQISDPALKQGVFDIWLEVAAECAWDRFEDVPKNLEDEVGRPLVEHILGVTRMALAMADIAERDNGLKYNRDYLLAACLLHDVTKPVETEPDPKGTPGSDKVKAGKKSELGKKIQHAGYATHKIFNHNLPLEVAHLVLTHTHASNLRANSIEASFLFFADFADSDVGVLPTGARSWASRVHFEGRGTR